VFASHLQTAHFKTTALPSDTTILGSFADGKNSFSFDEHRRVLMQKTDGRYWQSENTDGKFIRKKSIDIVIGSGTKGQSFMSWTGERLVQLPMTYFTAADQWSNSPGYPNTIIFNRPITSRCLECHTTFAKVISEAGEEPEAFDRWKMILGVDCQKCHGAAQAHVDFHENSGKGADPIINPAKFSRQQSLDLCASCHGGRLSKTAPSFSFNAGDTLSHFFTIDTTSPDPSKIDVHGNQLGLLKASKCFRMSGTLTCVTCHNTHANERGQLEVFSARCRNCHDATHAPVCDLAATKGTVINNNCIDCHMPKQASRAIAVHLDERSAPVAAMIRSHYVAIYRDTLQHVTVPR
jgi:Cytochrome c554 and c-prime